MSDLRDRLPPDDYICARLQRIEVEVQVGLHPWELHPEKPTRLWVDVELYSLNPPRRPAGLYEVIDYDRMRNYVRAWWSSASTTSVSTRCACRCSSRTSSTRRTAPGWSCSGGG